MILLPVGIVWVGYLLTWYGFMVMRGPGVGIMDLILPGRVGAVGRELAGTGGSAAPAGTASSQPTSSAPATAVPRGTINAPVHHT